MATTGARPRIMTSEGYKLLREAFESGTVYPTRQEKQELLKRVQALEGCSGYPLKNMEVWFSVRRKTAGIMPEHGRRRGRPRPQNTVSSLKPDQVNMLQILYQGTDGQPRQDLIDTWAKLLRVPSTDVTAWVQAEQEKGCHVEAEPEARDDSLEEVFGEDREDPQAFVKHLLISIHQDVIDSYTNDDSKPRNSEDFVRMFEPHKQAMQKFLANAERGSLESFGFSAGAIPL